MDLLKIASVPATTVSPETTVLEAVRLMSEERVGAVAVTREGKLTGIFTERDLMIRVVLEGRNPAATRVGDVMTSQCISAKNDLSMGDALQIMTESHFRHLPVVDENDRVLGLLSIRNLLHNRVDKLSQELDSVVAFFTATRADDLKSFRKTLIFQLPADGLREHRRRSNRRTAERGLEGLCLVNAMHITASVFINDDESGLHRDYEVWLEKLAPHEPVSQYQHNRTGEDNGDAHLKRQVMGREVVVAVTNGKLDFGPWEQIFYGNLPPPEARPNQNHGRLKVFLVFHFLPRFLAVQYDRGIGEEIPAHVSAGHFPRARCCRRETAAPHPSRSRSRNPRPLVGHREKRAEAERTRGTTDLPPCAVHPRSAHSFPSPPRSTTFPSTIPELQPQNRPPDH
jgi:secondary thiamine-phosphate synthase enzyme